MVNKLDGVEINNIDNSGSGSSSAENNNNIVAEHNKPRIKETTPCLLNEIDEQFNNLMDKIDLNNDEEIKNHFTHVRVLHNFRGSNNDELCMKKDDVSLFFGTHLFAIILIVFLFYSKIITLTQTPSGGWWEGTLDGITGWFPANYVQPISNQDPLYQQLVHGQQQDSGGIEPRSGSTELYSGYHSGDWNSHPGTPMMTGDLIGDHLAEYRSIVMKVIEDSETQFIESLQDAINHYLMPVYQFKM